MNDRKNSVNGAPLLGAWFNKNNFREMRLILNKNELPPEGFVRARPLHGTEYQFYDEAAGEWKPHPDATVLAMSKKYKAELAEIDRSTGAGRAVRALALSVAEKNKITGPDYHALKTQEDRAGVLRASLAGLAKEVQQ